MKKNVEKMLVALEGIENIGDAPPFYIGTIKQALSDVGSVFEHEREQEQELLKALDRNFFEFSK